MVVVPVGDEDVRQVDVLVLEDALEVVDVLGDVGVAGVDEDAPGEKISFKTTGLIVGKF